MKTKKKNKAKPILEPLGNHHNRAAFDCGNESLNEYFRKQIDYDQKNRLSVPYVLINVETNEILGFYTLSATSLSMQKLKNHIPVEVQGMIPYTSVPAILLGRMAVHKDSQGQGYGCALLADALTVCKDASTKAGSKVVVVDAMDEKACRFYEKQGFIRLSSQSLKLFYPIDSIP